MRLIGLHGKPRAGKDTVADRLVARHNFVKLGFSDALYAEVAEAFSVPAEWLQDEQRKDTPQPWMAFGLCRSMEFLAYMQQVGGLTASHAPRTPRQILQWWGTEYRRRQNISYWLDRLQDAVDAVRPTGVNVVVRDCRFENEAEWIRTRHGKIYEIVRPSLPDEHTHSAERRLPGELIDATIFNATDITWLNFCADFIGYSDMPI